MRKRKKRENALDEAVRLAHENGMSYAQFQKLETAGKAKIIRGVLHIDKADKEAIE